MDLDSYIRLISSYLGPNKSLKFVGEDDCKMLVGCVSDIINEISSQHPANRVIRSCVQTHHSNFGCSSTTHLSMFCFWYRALLKIQNDGCNIANLISKLDEILESGIESLTQITSSFYDKVKDCFVTTDTSQYLESNCLAEISPYISKTDSLQKLKHFLRCLGHESDFLADLLATAWSKQINKAPLSKETLEFSTSEITAVTANSLPSHSKVVDGILLRTNHENVEILIGWQQRNIRTLLINGNITHTFMHKGVNLPKNWEMINEHSDSSARKSLWVSETLTTLKQLGVALILASGKIDSDFITHLNVNNICAVGNTRVDILELIANATGAALASYIIDCDELNVATCLKVSVEDTLSIVGRTNSFKDFYITLHLPSSYQTVLICHPISGYLSCLEHNFWHLAHRLAHVSSTDKMLPGSCQTEEYVVTVLQSIPAADAVSQLALRVILDGFRDFIATVRTKFVDDSRTGGDADVTDNQTFDDYLSKIESWRSALKLACLIAQTDRAIISGDISDYKEKTSGISSAFLGIL